MSVQGGTITFGVLKENIFLFVSPRWPFAFISVITADQRFSQIPTMAWPLEGGLGCSPG